MLRCFIILVFVICHQSSGVSQNVMVKGMVDSTYFSTANSIYAYTYDDHISYREKELASAKFDMDGNFSLSFPVSSTSYIFLTVDNAKAEMVVEPGKAYGVYFMPKDTDAVNTLGIAVPVGLHFVNTGKRELNFLIADFTGRYDQMLEDYQAGIARKESAIFKKIDTLENLFRRKYAEYNDRYLENHIDYTFALLDESIMLREKDRIFDQYIKTKRVQLDNYDYMAFFHQFYASVSEGLMGDPKLQVEIGKQKFSALVEFFGSNRFLANDTIREAVVLKSLSEYSRYPAIKTNYVLEMLGQAAVQCKSELNRKSAASLKKRISAMNAGDPAPRVAFKDVNGKSVSLSDFKGKYVYVNFWTSWCSSCTQEMMLIPELKKTYGSRIAFLSICLDKSPEIMKNFLKKNPKLDWNFLYCDNYKIAKEEFKVLAVPAYYLIDPKGNVFRSPADKPQDLEPLFIQLKKKR